MKALNPFWDKSGYNTHMDKCIRQIKTDTFNGLKYLPGEILFKSICKHLYIGDIKEIHLCSSKINVIKIVCKIFF